MNTLFAESEGTFDQNRYKPLWLRICHGTVDHSFVAKNSYVWPMPSSGSLTPDGLHLCVFLTNLLELIEDQILKATNLGRA